MLKVEKELIEIRQSGIKSVAICLMHAYTFPKHEIMLGEFCRSLGFESISLSSSSSPMIKIVPRGMSAMADAYLTPSIHQYLTSFFSGFDRGISECVNGKDPVKVEFMQSDGGLTNYSTFNGFKAILSGPAGGVIGYAMTSWNGKTGVIGFDMGGTSTDVSRYGGNLEHVFESITAGITIQAPQLDINTVAAGGGSILSFRNGMFAVGPESAGANPGPCCYRKGGPLTITDANLILGKLLPEFFPPIFGPNENEMLNVSATVASFEKIRAEINNHISQAGGELLSIDEIAQGFVKIANESMTRPIRALTQGKGYNPKDHILACFGGAGGQHAFAVARSLGVSMILVHKFSSVLSAYGIALADVVHEEQSPCALVLSQENFAQLKQTSAVLRERCKAHLVKDKSSPDDIYTELYLNLRYEGTDTSIMTRQVKENEWNFEDTFVANYKQEFGFTLPDRQIIVDDIRIRGFAKNAATGQNVSWTNVHSELESVVIVEPPEPVQNGMIFWENLGRTSTNVYSLSSLPIGCKINGPALIIDSTSTISVEPNCHVIITSEHVVGFLDSVKKVNVDTRVDPINLGVFGHRFMGIAEQMGRTLQKTAISTNIKERLDFSCALFGPDGGLVANAPHIPVHLGSMQEAVRWQMQFLKDDLKENDVILSNHPQAGGSHLPDVFFSKTRLP
jgi:5-oxoprolinase (ATP-hydrolysing)